VSNILALTVATGWAAVVQYPGGQLERIPLVCWGLLQVGPYQTKAVGLVHVDGGVIQPVTEVYGPGSQLAGELVGYASPDEALPNQLVFAPVAGPVSSSTSGGAEHNLLLRLLRALLTDYSDLKKRMSDNASAESVLDYVLVDLRGCLSALEDPGASQNRLNHILGQPVTLSDDRSNTTAGSVTPGQAPC
jgi:hypothetical protein